MRIVSSLTFAALLLGVALFGQSGNSAPPTQIFHVRGTITGPRGDDVVPGAEITFQGEHESKTVFADSKGSYEADLPVGLYTMKAQFQFQLGRSPYFLKYVRPLFRVASPTSLVLNVTMFAQRFTCDIVVSNGSGKPATPEQWEEGSKALCGGEEFFPLTSHDGVPFQLYIRYPKRSLVDQAYVYSGDKLATDTYTPVLVEYNLATLFANSIVYDMGRSTIEAKGGVTLLNETGAKQQADSMTIRIENGEATRLR
jgi:hypothetical protein